MVSKKAKHLDGNDVQTSDDNIAKEFKKILPMAEKIKCKIAIENHFAFPSTRMANIIKLVGHDHLGACLDVANSICAGEWPDETIDCLSDHTINLHISLASRPVSIYQYAMKLTLFPTIEAPNENPYRQNSSLFRQQQPCLG